MNNRRHFSRLLCAGFFLFSSSLVSAVSASHGSRLWQTDEGLPHNAVHAVAQTSDGYLWVGTRSGLARFDGVRFVRFDSRNVPALKSSSILSLCASRDGTLWIGTEGGGLTKFKEGEFIYVDRPDDLPGPVIRSIHETEDSSIWIGSYGAGLTRIRHGVFTRFTRAEGLADDTVRAVSEDRQKNLWVATIWGLTRLKDTAAQTFTEDSGLKHNSVRAVCEDREGNIWIGSNGGLTRFRDGKFMHFTKTDGLSDNVVSALCLDQKGVLWIGTYEGLTRYENGEFTTVARDDGESLNQVHAIFEDREHNLWVGTKEGLVRLRSRSFRTYTKRDGLTHNAITSVFEDNSGALWIGTGGGLNFFRDGAFGAYTTTNGLRSDLVRGIHESRDGSLWFGTWYDGGLNRLQHGTFTYFGRPELWDSPENVILEDRSGNLWLGSPFALNRLKDGQFTRYSKENWLPHENVLSLCEDHEGSIWIGTGSGLVRWKEEKFLANGLERFAHKRILALYEDRDRALWISAEGAGLTRIKNGIYTDYATRDGLFTDAVSEILEDGKGFYWIASPIGIGRFSKKEIEDFDRKKIAAFSCAVFGKGDGMASVECQNIAKPSAIRSRDGRLWFSTIKGLVAVNPSEINLNESVPPVVIENVIADKRNVMGDKWQMAGKAAHLDTRHVSPVTLPPGGGELEFHYTALSLVAPEKNRFKYKLEGFDKDWVDSGTRRIAYYNNLSPGTYTFHVQACNNEGVWNSLGANVKFRLLPHFWQTTWFIALIGLIAASGVAGLARYVTWKKLQGRLQRLEQQHAVERERTRIAQDMHDDLGVRITEIILLSDRARTTQNAQDQKDANAAISEAAREMAVNLKAIVWAVSPGNDSLDRVVPYIGDYVVKYLSKSSVRCRLDVPDELPKAIVSSTARHNLFLVVKEAVNNIAKYAEASEVWLRLKCSHSLLTVVIEDNGKGFSRNAVSAFANGLVNMEKRMEKIGGHFDLCSEPGKGTRIRLEIPLRSDGD